MPKTPSADRPESAETLLFGVPPPPEDHEQLPEGISLCMILKNEERFLEACLRSVEGIVDEINIVDTGSTDRTLEIAAQFGATVQHREWRSDFSWARNEALAMATKRWTLVLDGDEEIAPESRRHLLDLRTVPAYLTVLYTRIHNDTTEHGASTMMSHSLPRIFPTTPRIRYRGLIHETLVVDDGKTRATAVITPIRILHRGYTLEIIGARKKDDRNAPLLQRSTIENPDDSFSWFNYANYLIGHEQFDEGIAAMERMVEMERGKDMRGYVPLGYVFLSGAYASQRGDWDKALEIVDECLERAPGYVLAIYGKAEIFARAGRFEEAREWFKKAIDTKAQEERYNVVDEEITLWKSQSNIAATYVNEGKFEEAIPWLEEAHRNKPDIWMVEERLAWVFERCKRYFDAEIVLREAFERRKTEETAAAYVNYLVRRQRMTRALEVIEEALACLDGGVVASLNTAAAAIVRKTRSADPVPYLLAALAKAPGHGLALGMLEELYRERGDELSLARMRRDEMEAPLVNGADYVRRTHRLLEEMNFEEAARIAESGLVKDPSTAALLFNLGLALAQIEGQVDRAIDVLGLVRTGEREIIETGAFLRASLLEKKGMLVEAQGALEGIFGEKPENEDALLMQARLLQGAGRVGPAEEMLRSAMGAGRKRVGLELAALMLREGRYAEARDIADEAMATA
ncbi:MAG: tetratricopeptide repeat protein [Vulcanimicrobiaceae bacterium]